MLVLELMSIIIVTSLYKIKSTFSSLLSIISVFVLESAMFFSLLMNIYAKSLNLKWLP